MTRDAQEQRQRDMKNLCQAQYRGGDKPAFLNARCKRIVDHEGQHMSWRGSQGPQGDYRRILEWP